MIAKLTTCGFVPCSLYWPVRPLRRGRRSGLPAASRMGLHIGVVIVAMLRMVVNIYGKLSVGQVLY